MRARTSPRASQDDSLWVVSSDVVFLVDFLPVPLQPHRQMAGRFQLGVNLERLVRAGHLEAVDRRDDVAVLQADLRERAVGPHAEETEAGRLAVADLGHDARR